MKNYFYYNLFVIKSCMYIMLLNIVLFFQDEIPLDRTFIPIRIWLWPKRCLFYHSIKFTTSNCLHCSFKRYYLSLPTVGQWRNWFGSKNVDICIQNIVFIDSKQRYDRHICQSTMEKINFKLIDKINGPYINVLEYLAFIN